MQIDTCEDLSLLSHMEYELEATETVVPCYFQDGRAATYVSIMFAPCAHDGLQIPTCTACYEWAKKKFDLGAIYCNACYEKGVMTKIVKMEWRRL